MYKIDVSSAHVFKYKQYLAAFNRKIPSGFVTATSHNRDEVWNLLKMHNRTARCKGSNHDAVPSIAARSTVSNLCITRDTFNIRISVRSVQDVLFLNCLDVERKAVEHLIQYFTEYMCLVRRDLTKLSCTP